MTVRVLSSYILLPHWKSRERSRSTQNKHRDLQALTMFLEYTG